MHSGFFKVPSNFYAYTFGLSLQKWYFSFSSFCSNSKAFSFQKFLPFSDFFPTFPQLHVFCFLRSLVRFVQNFFPFPVYPPWPLQVSHLCKLWKTVEELDLKRDVAVLLLTDVDWKETRVVLPRSAGVQTMQPILCCTRYTTTPSQTITSVTLSPFVQLSS